MDLLTLLSDYLWADIPMLLTPVLAVYSKETMAQIRCEIKSLVGSSVLEAVIYSSETDLSNHFGHRISVRILRQSYLLFRYTPDRVV